MRTLLVLISALTFSLASLDAQQSVPPPRPKVVSKPTPKPPLLKRMFGREKATPTPAPVATVKATPSPKPKARSKPRSTARATRPEPKSEEEKPATTAETQPPASNEEKKTAETKPVVESQPPADSSEKKTAAADKRGARKTQPPKPNKLDTTGMDDSTKYQAVKAVALEDTKLKELKEKADGAISDADAHAASVAYNRALFRKIRDLEPSLDGYVDRMETAMMKRLNSERRGQ